MLLPQGLADAPEGPPGAGERHVLRLHPRLDRVGRVEDEVVADARRGARQHLLVERQRRRVRGARGGRRVVVLAAQRRHALVAAKPRGRAAGLADQGAQLAAPEAEQALVAEDRGDQGQRTRRARVGGRERHLHLALDELDGREQQRGEGARGGTADQQGRQRQGLGRRVQGGLQRLLDDAVAEEQAAVLDGGAHQRGADAPVEAADSLHLERLAEAVQGPAVPEGQVVGLRLEPHLDGVERVLDELARDARGLGEESARADGIQWTGENAQIQRLHP